MLNPPKPPRRVVIFGLDVGQEGDPPAIAVTERIGNPPARFVMGHVERLPLQWEYDEQAQHTWDLVTHPTMAEARRFIVVDATECGRAVPEMLNRRFALNPPNVELISLVAVTITAGDVMTVVKGYPWRWLNVPKRDIVTALRVVLAGLRFEVADSPGAVHWRQEMQTFRRRMGQKRGTYEAEREGQHDDTVMASALTCWYGEYVLGELGARRKPGAPAQAVMTLKL